MKYEKHIKKCLLTEKVPANSVFLKIEREQVYEQVNNPLTTTYQQGSTIPIVSRVSPVDQFYNVPMKCVEYAYWEIYSEASGD